MTNLLKPLLEAISQTQSEPDMRSQIVPKMGEYFAVLKRMFRKLEVSLRAEMVAQLTDFASPRLG